MEFSVGTVQDVIVVKAWGTPDEDSYERSLKGVMQHPAWPDQRAFVWDCTDVDVAEISVAGLRRLSQIASRVLGSESLVVMAILAPSPLKYGMARMWAARLDDSIVGAVVIANSGEEALKVVAEATGAGRPIVVNGPGKA